MEVKKLQKAYGVTEEDRNGSKVLTKVLHWRNESSAPFLVPRINTRVILQFLVAILP